MGSVKIKKSLGSLDTLWQETHILLMGVKSGELSVVGWVPMAHSAFPPTACSSGPALSLGERFQGQNCEFKSCSDPPCVSPGKLLNLSEPDVVHLCSADLV